MFKGANAGMGLLILRVVIGVVFLAHGLGKFFGSPFVGFGIDGTMGFFASIGIPVPHILVWFSALLETVGGAALILGVGVPVFALLLGMEMVVALIKVHLTAGFAVSGEAFGYEYALTLIAGLACLMLSGPGMLAVQLRPKTT